MLNQEETPFAQRFQRIQSIIFRTNRILTDKIAGKPRKSWQK